MAIYHYSVQIVQRSKGQSAVAAAAYRSGTKLRDRRLGETHDYTRKEKVAHSEILAPPGAPGWANNREALWNQVEAIEKRIDSQVARLVNVALPKELTLEQCVELLRGFCREQYVDLGMIADLSVRWNENNPHAHIMLTTRLIEQNSGQFGAKNRDWGTKALLMTHRKAWAEHLNQALAEAGEEVRVDHRSFEDQGITNRLPQVHLGKGITELIKKGKCEDIADHSRVIQHQYIDQTNADIRQLETEIKQLETEAELQQLSA